MLNKKLIILPLLLVSPLLSQCTSTAPTDLLWSQPGTIYSHGKSTITLKIDDNKSVTFKNTFSKDAIKNLDLSKYNGSLKDAKYVDSKTVNLIFAVNYDGSLGESDKVFFDIDTSYFEGSAPVETAKVETSVYYSRIEDNSVSNNILKGTIYGAEFIPMNEFHDFVVPTTSVILSSAKYKLTAIQGDINKIQIEIQGVAKPNIEVGKSESVNLNIPSSCFQNVDNCYLPLLISVSKTTEAAYTDVYLTFVTKNGFIFKK